VGVYCDVAICVRAKGPLEAEVRARLVALAREHELLRGVCAIGVAEEDVKPATWREWLAKHLLFRKLGRSLAAHARTPNGGLHFQRGVREAARGDAGPWLDERARELGTDFIVACDGPLWKGDADNATQGFRYVALREPAEMPRSNAYQPADKNPFVENEGGVFWDVLSLCAKRNLDGRIAARSPFVRAIKKELGLAVTCRASWW
jgi:hypothetical protein